MWKYIKGTEKDFEGLPEETQYILRDNFWRSLLYYMVTDGNLFVANKDDLTWIPSTHPNIAVAETKEDGTIIAHREWIEVSPVETKPEEQQPLPTSEDMNPANGLPKIKLDVKKPVFYKETDEEVRFIHSNSLYHLFEKEDCTILNVTTDNLDNCFYNKPETKTTVEVLDSAWKRACNAGSLWASPTQLFYMAIEQLVKDGVVDMNKVYEVKQ